MARLSSTTTSPGRSVGSEHLLDIGEKRRIVERAIEDRRGLQAVDRNAAITVCVCQCPHGV